MTIAHNRWLFFGLKVFCSMGFFYPIWYLYEQQFLSLSQIALLEGIIVAIQIFLEIPTGAIADLYGLKVSVALGYVFQAFACLAFLFARTFPMFIIYAFLLGLGESLKSGAEDALEYDSLKAIGKEDEFAKYKSWYSLTFQICFGISFIVGGNIGQYNLSTTIWMTGIAFTMCAIISMLFVEPPKKPSNFSVNKYLTQLKQGWFELTDNSYITHITALYVGIGGITWVTNLSLMNIYLGQIGFSPMELGWVTGILRILNILILMKLLKRLITPHLTSKVFYFYLLIFSLGYLPAIFLPKWGAVGLVSLIMVSTTARWIVLGNYLNRQISSENRATALSTASMLISIFHMLVMLGPALLMPYIGGAKTLISILGIMGVSICLWLLKNNHQVVKEYLNAYQKNRS